MFNAAVVVLMLITSADAKVDLEAIYRDLGQHGAARSAAVLALASVPEQAVPFLAEKLKPLKLEEADARELVFALMCEDAKKREAAEKTLRYYDPRLALPIQDIWALAITNDQKRRLAVFFRGPHEDDPECEFELFDRRDGNYSIIAKKFQNGVRVSGGMISDPWKLPQLFWERESTALVILDYLGTAEAKKIIAAMATGHPQARPTVIAKGLLKGERFERRGGGERPGTTKPPQRARQFISTRAAEPTPAELEENWKDLSAHGFEQIRALLWFMSREKAAIPFFKTKLVPLKLTVARARELMTDALDDSEAKREAAKKIMKTYDPRLALTIPEMWAMATNGLQQRRVLAVLGIGYENKYVYRIEERPGENMCSLYADIQLAGGGLQNAYSTFISGVDRLFYPAEINAIVLLGHYGSDEAMKLVREMATGHAEIEPTKAARAVLQRKAK